MDYLVEIDIISNRCAVLGEELKELLPDHELLRFDADEKSDSEKDALLDDLLKNFGPGEVSDGYIPSNRVLYETFLNFQSALEAAVVTQKAKIGVFKPLTGDDYG